MNSSNENDLSGVRVAILVADGVEQVELTGPRDALEKAGATPLIVSPADKDIQGMNHDEKGDMFAVDVHLDDANPDDFDALLLPGGLINPDTLRSTPAAVKFARSFFEAGKPVAAICHGPQVLIEAGVLKGRKLTSWPAIQTDIKNAGGNWVDQEVVTDHGFVTSRKPDDIPAFNKKMVEEFAEGYHAAQKELSHA